jgi:hypothetical protein
VRSARHGVRQVLRIQLPGGHTTSGNVRVVPVMVARSRPKMLLCAFGSALFVVASLAIIAQGSAITLLVGVVGVVTFSGFGLGWILMSLRTGPGLVVDETGFDDRSSLVAVGRVMWSDVLSVSQWTAFGSSHVIVKVRNPELYAAGQSWFARLAGFANSKLVGSPVTIASTGLRTNFDDLFALLSNAHEQHHLTQL